MGQQQGRFSGRQITVMVVAVCMAIVAFPVGVFAATGSFVNITDPIKKAEKARVVKGSLRVGDGQGAMTVDGTLAARQAPPTQPFRLNPNAFATNPVSFVKLGAVPAGRGVALSTVSLTANQGGVTTFGLMWRLSSDNCVSDIQFPVPGDVGSGDIGAWMVQSRSSFVVPYATPFVIPPTPGKSVCFYVNPTSDTNGLAWLSLHGYLL